MTPSTDSENGGSVEPSGEKTWKYTGEGLGHANGKHFGAELPAGGEVTVKSQPVRNGEVTFTVNYEHEEADVGLLGKFSPEDAEEFARDLLECAAGAREQQTEEDAE